MLVYLFVHLYCYGTSWKKLTEESATGPIRSRSSVHYERRGEKQSERQNIIVIGVIRET